MPCNHSDVGYVENLKVKVSSCAEDISREVVTTKVPFFLERSIYTL